MILSLLVLSYNFVMVSLRSVLVTMRCVLVPIGFDCRNCTSTIRIVTNTLCRETVTKSLSNSDNIVD